VLGAAGALGEALDALPGEVSGEAPSEVSGEAA